MEEMSGHFHHQEFRRGVEVFEVDLRWGITEEQRERGETLPMLLAEIDLSVPWPRLSLEGK